MIFVAGVHGVGKTFFSNQVSKKLKLEVFDASQLIEKEKNKKFLKSKRVKEPNSNQQCLIDAVECIKLHNKSFILNGHFCLIDKQGKIVRLEKNVFKALAPDKIILLEEEPAIIVQRRFERDNEKIDINFVRMFIDIERTYAYQIAEENKIPILTISPIIDYEKVLWFIGSNI